MSTSACTCVEMRWTILMMHTRARTRSFYPSAILRAAEGVAFRDVVENDNRFA
jgi:hypothetical protein